MPQLDKETATKVDEQESGFAPLEDGLYEGTLLDVTVSQGPSGEYWRWEFGELVNVETGAAASGRQWLNTSLTEKALWKLKETFEAFGVTPETDTDELIGERVRLAVSQRLIQSGPRMGEVGNQIDRLVPVGEQG